MLTPEAPAAAEEPAPDGSAASPGASALLLRRPGASARARENVNEPFFGAGKMNSDILI